MDMQHPEQLEKKPGSRLYRGEYFFFNKRNRSFTSNLAQSIGTRPIQITLSGIVFRADLMNVAPFVLQHISLPKDAHFRTHRMGNAEVPFVSHETLVNANHSYKIEKCFVGQSIIIEPKAGLVESAARELEQDGIVLLTGNITESYVTVKIYLPDSWSVRIEEALEPIQTVSPPSVADSIKSAIERHGFPSQPMPPRPKSSPAITPSQDELFALRNFKKAAAALLEDDTLIMIENLATDIGQTKSERGRTSPFGLRRFRVE